MAVNAIDTIAASGGTFGHRERGTSQPRARPASLTPSCHPHCHLRSWARGRGKDVALQLCGPGAASRPVVLPICHKGACREQAVSSDASLKPGEIIHGGTCTGLGCLLFHSTVQFSNFFYCHPKILKNMFSICPKQKTKNKKPVSKNKQHFPQLSVRRQANQSRQNKAVAKASSQRQRLSKPILTSHSSRSTVMSHHTGTLSHSAKRFCQVSVALTPTQVYRSPTQSPRLHAIKRVGNRI